MAQWYALRTESRQERAVAAGLAERGLTVFLPMETDWRGQPRVKHMEPILPGYVFVLMTCDNDFAEVHELEHVGGFVRYLGDDQIMWPMPFPTCDILRFQSDERAGLFDKTRNVAPPRYRPKKGSRVQITAGDYYGHFAKVISAPSKDRRKLAIEGFDPPRHKTLEVSQLAAA